MAITVNSNISSLIVQKNLKDATNALNRSIERMSTGYRVNHAKDDAAGYSIITDWTSRLSSWEVASQNTAMGLDLLATAEENYGLITSHLQRVRDLTEQAANGTYGTAALGAIEVEITARLQEISRIAENAEYNGIQLMDGSILADINLQVGVTGNDFSKITLSSRLFGDASASTLFGGDSNETIAANCTGTTATSMLTEIDEAIKTLTDRTTQLGAAQNRLESAATSIDVQIENITSSLSTIRDSDVAEESSNYIQAQILQQASATLLATANQVPSIALNLI